MQHVLEVKEEEECIPTIRQMLNGQRIIRIDGHSGMGKSRIAKSYCSIFGWAHLPGDNFLIDPRPRGFYHDKVDRAAYRLAAERGLADRPGIVLDAICLDCLIEPLTLGPEFRIYMLSITDPEFAADDRNRNRKLGSTAYHLAVDPKTKADLVIWKRARF